VPAEVALVVSNRASAGALAIAGRHGVPTSVLAAPSDGRSLLALLAQHRIDFIALAGYLKQIPAPVTETWGGRIVNVHPALLPAFGGPGMYGPRVHQAVIAAGVRVSGVTVHFVDAVYDNGPIIAQWPVPVRSDDTPTALAERVLRVEHRLYPAVVEAVASGAVTLGPDGRVHGHVFDASGTATFSLQSEGQSP
jgi:folate-dependent phosphoribosylglycinamide formyltransferase PurN